MASELTVGEVATRSGVAVSALHFYETRGLIRSHRTGGNQRRYGARRAEAGGGDQDRAGGRHFAGRHRRCAWLPCPTGERRRARIGHLLSTAWRDDLDHRIEQLKKLRDGLTDCIGCGCMSIDRCPLRNREDRLARQGPGARRLMVKD